MTKYVWIPKNIIFNKNIYISGSTSKPSNEIERAYEIWEHAKNLIYQNTDNFNLSDGITNLKRSLNHRLKLIEEVYNLKKIEIEDKPNGYIETLSHLEIIRPLFLKKLLAIRNDIEHNDALPPSKKKCIEFVDIIWYFLKSTDLLLAQIKTSFTVEDYGSEDQSLAGCEFEINFDFKKLRIDIRGWFPGKYVSEEEKVGSIKIKVKSLKTKANYKKNLEYLKKRLDSDIGLTGEILFTPKESLEFHRNIFRNY